MVLEAAIVFASSILVFIVWTVVVILERKRKRRLFLNSLRSWFDSLIESGEASVSRNWRHFTRYILKLHWYYSLHSVLQTFLRVIVTTYHYFESAFEKNRMKAKRLRAEKRQIKEGSHLGQVVKHKKDTELTPSQQRKLKDKKLKGD